MLSTYEMQGFHPKWYQALLVLRQMGMWVLPLGNLNLEAYETAAELGTVGVGVLYCVVVQTSFRVQKNSASFDSVRKEKEKLRAILQAIPEGLLVITGELEVSCCNAWAFTDTEDLDSEEIAKELREMNCVKDTEETKSLWELVAAFIGSDKDRFATFGTVNIAGRYFEMKGTKCNWDDTDACILTASDISSWVESQLKLREESDSKTSLLRFVSHELRTPSNAILNLAGNVLQTASLKAEEQLQLSVVVTSTHFLLSVVNDLLDFTRIASDKFLLVKQSFDFRQEMQETVRLIELQCRQKGLSLRVNFDPLIPEAVYSDAARIKQVVLNLLGNALKFTFHGDIRVICMLTDHNTVKVAVTDTGIGIPESKIAGLCKAFEKVEGTQRINPQGCGLGLYISNLLAISLGSRPISIHSQLQAGSEFSFEVHIYQQESPLVDYSPPIDAESDIEIERCTEATISPSLCAEKQLGARHYPDILVVDDSEFNRLVLIKLLEAMNIPADEASSGLRALSLIRFKAARNHYYRLILMDMEMPEMDGITATQEIRTMEVTGELQLRPRIICCSAHRGQEDVDRSLAAGMDDYIEKPINRMQLQALLFAF